MNICKKTMLLMALCCSLGAPTSAVDAEPQDQLAQTKRIKEDLTKEAQEIVKETNDSIKCKKEDLKKEALEIVKEALKIVKETQERYMGLFGYCSLMHFESRYSGTYCEDKEKHRVDNKNFEFKELRGIFTELDKFESNLNILKDRIRKVTEDFQNPEELCHNGRMEDWDTLMDMVTLLHNTFGEARKNTLKSVKKELIEVEGFKKIKELLNNANEEENLVKLLNMVQKKETKHKTRILNSAHAENSNGKLQEASDEKIVTVCRAITYNIAHCFIKHIHDKLKGLDGETYEINFKAPTVVYSFIKHIHNKLKKLDCDTNKIKIIEFNRHKRHCNKIKSIGPDSEKRQRRN